MSYHELIERADELLCGIRDAGWSTDPETGEELPDITALGELLTALRDGQPRIERVAVLVAVDDAPDVSYLGRYADGFWATATEPEAERWRVTDRTAVVREDKRQARYFIADNVSDRTEAEAAYARAEAFRLGDWWMVSVHVHARVSYPTGGGGRRIQRFESAGLFGVESDSSPEHIREVAGEEWAELRDHLARFGVGSQAWAECVADGRAEVVQNG